MIEEWDPFAPMPDAGEQPTEAVSTTGHQVQPWKVIVVDDEESIHAVTRLVLGKTIFLNRPVAICNAYSAAEGLAMLAQHPDTAVMLIDVVMETDHAGLDLIHQIRHTLKNHQVRLLIRTGQPGMAPEKEVIHAYDINGYYEKTELTAQKLYTTVYAGIRSYGDIMDVVTYQKGLERMIQMGRIIFQCPSIHDLWTTVMEQAGSLFPGPGYAGIWQWEDGAVPQGLPRLHMPEGAVVPPEAWARLIDVRDAIAHVFAERYTLLAWKSTTGQISAYYRMHEQPLEDRARSWCEIFARDVQSMWDNLVLHQEIEETQRELIYRLGEAVESRSKETGNHVRRVAHITERLALEYGLSPIEAYRLKLASPMHDLGKIAIPDAILHKPSKLDPEEWAVMQTHAEQGYAILKGSHRPVLQAAALLAWEHHEKWDGTGYPRGLQGEAISLPGRITAVADVYDALSSERVYKPAWSSDKIQDFFREQSGKHFDPRLVDILLCHYDAFERIRALYPDSPPDPDAESGVSHGVRYNTRIDR